MFVTERSTNTAQLLITVCCLKLYRSCWNTAYSQTLPAGSTFTPAVILHDRHSMFGCWEFSVVGQMTWSLLLDSLRDPTCSFDSFWSDLKTSFLTLFAYMACKRCSTNLRLTTITTVTLRTQRCRLCPWSEWETRSAWRPCENGDCRRQQRASTTHKPTHDTYTMDSLQVLWCSS